MMATQKRCIALRAVLAAWAAMLAPTLAHAGSVTATAVMISGRVGIRANASRLDLAGVTLRASEKGVDAAGASRIYFSVSEYDAPDYHGDAHFTWPTPKR